MSEIGRSLSRGCLRSAVIRVIAVVIAVPLWCGLIIVPLAVVSNDPNASVWWLIVPGALFLLLTTGGPIGFLAWTIWQRSRGLDAAFTPLGFTGQIHHMFYRQYHGTLQGRRVGAYVTRGPLLDLTVETSLQTRLGVSQRRSATGGETDTALFARLFNRQPLATDDPELDDLLVFPHDEDWTRALLADPEARAALRRLTATEGDFVRRHIILRPGTLQLRLFGSRRLLTFTIDVTTDEIRQSFDDLLTLARIAESLPAPQRTAEETGMERLAQGTHRPGLVLGITAAAIVVLVLCPMVVAAATIAVLLLLD